MKAAVLFDQNEMPKYVDFPDPVLQNENDVMISVKAAAIKHLDKARASGKHYSTENIKHEPKIIGGDGVGILEDGTRVYAIGVSGMIAEKALIEKNRMVKLPETLDDATAAAIPNAVIGSAMALLYRAGMQPGETVLINGATSFTGKMAVQLAKHYGAKKIIVSGRNEQSLQGLLALGADEIITINNADENFAAQFKRIHSDTPIDIVIDYLWGKTAELILAGLKGKGSFTHRTRFVSVGAITGDVIQLSAANLRSVDLQLTGSGLGSWTKEQVQKLFTDILPEVFELAAKNKIKVDTVKANLKDIETLWNTDAEDGKRIVVMM